MRIGIIAEGRADLAVIRNLLKGFCNIDSSDIQNISPEYNCDETDLAQMQIGQFGTWTLVKKECQEKLEINQFFQVEGERFLIIQLDADNRMQSDYDVVTPRTLSTKEDIKALRQNIIDKIKSWLNTPVFDDKIFYAVAIDSIEAWVLSIYTNEGETGFLLDTKQKLRAKINTSFTEKERKQLFALKMYDYFLAISKDFKKLKTLRLCLTKNQSLEDFVASLEEIKKD